MDHGRRVIRRPARFSGFAEKPPRTVKRKEVIDERNGRYAQENVCEVARRHSGRRVGKSNRVLLGGPGTTDWLVFTVSIRGPKIVEPDNRFRAAIILLQEPVLSEYLWSVLRAPKE